MTDADCLFCKIVAGEIPNDTVTETEDVLAFRDISPKVPVHVLVVPKQHSTHAGELAGSEPELLAQVMRVGAEVARSEGVAESGYRFVFNCGGDSGQEVFHTHLHVLGGRPLSMAV